MNSKAAIAAVSFIVAVSILVMAPIGESDAVEAGTYDELVTAFADASEGDTITLTKDIEVTSPVTVKVPVTLDLGGHTVTNLVTEERAFHVESSAFTVLGTTKGSAMVIPESNTSSYGFIKVVSESTVTLNGGTYSGDTYKGAFVKIANDGKTILGSGSTVIFNGVTMVSNNRFFTTDTLNTDASTPTLQVSGGKFTSDTMAFGVDTIALSPVSFTGVTVTAGTGPCIEVTGSAGTFTDCTFKVTGENDNGFGTTAVAVSCGGTAVIDGGTYSAPSGYGMYVYSSGGAITLKSGTVSGGVAAARAEVSSTQYPGATSTITAEGGTTEGSWVTNGNENASLSVVGGTHSADATKYVPEGMVVQTNTDGSYSVGSEEDMVASVGGTEYLTLQTAIDMAGGSTVTILGDIELTATVEVDRTDVTLDLNGKNITGAIKFNGLIKINGGASLTITDGADVHGKIANSAASASYGVYVSSNASLTLTDHVVIRDEGGSTGGAAVYLVSNDTNPPKLYVEDAELTAKNGFPVDASSKYSSVEVVVNGGYFKAEGKNLKTSLFSDCANNSGESKVPLIINGGTFANWNYDYDFSRIAEGKNLVISGNAPRITFTITSDAPESPIASLSKDGKNVYLLEGNLYTLIENAGYPISGNNAVNVLKDVTFNHPGYGYSSEASVPTMTIDIASGATLSGSMSLKVCDVVITGDGTVSEDMVFSPNGSTFIVTKVENGYQSRLNLSSD